MSYDAFGKPVQIRQYGLQKPQPKGLKTVVNPIAKAQQRKTGGPVGGFFGSDELEVDEEEESETGHRSNSSRYLFSALSLSSFAFDVGDAIFVNINHNNLPHLPCLPIDQSTRALSCMYGP